VPCVYILGWPQLKVGVVADLVFCVIVNVGEAMLVFNWIWISRLMSMSSGLYDTSSDTIYESIISYRLMHNIEVVDILQPKMMLTHLCMEVTNSNQNTNIYNTESKSSSNLLLGEFHVFQFMIRS